MSAATAPGDGDIHGDQRGRIIGTMVALLIITPGTVALRFLSRKLSRAGFWWDDYLSVVSLLVAVMNPSIWLYELRNGYGRHIAIYDQPEQIEKAAEWLKGFYASELIFHTSTTLSKFAILAFYHRVFPVPQFRRSLVYIAILCTVYMIAIDLAVIFQCQPIHYAWDQARPGAKGHCFHELDFFIGSGSVNAALNFLIFVLPIPLLRRLRTTTRQQIVLAAFFTLAGFVVLVSIVWVIVLSKLYQADVTWDYINTTIWTVLELNMAVVCACIPSLRPLFSVVGRGFSHPPLIRSSMTSTSAASTSKKIWGSGVRQSDGDFSQLDESDDMRPLGHGVSIHGGKGGAGQGDEEGIDLPENRITVQTEVTLETTDRLEYNDRLF